MLQSLVYSVLTLISGVVLSTTSCVTVVNTPPTGNNGGGSAPEKITVRFLNLTVFALDPLFYASSQPLGDVEVILFTPSNQIFADIGFAGRGIIPAGEPDEITIDCDQAVTIGTRGGQFINQDTGAAVGTGQQRFAGIGTIYQCGDTITLTYRAEGEGFATGLAAE